MADVRFPTSTNPVRRDPAANRVLAGTESSQDFTNANRFEAELKFMTMDKMNAMARNYAVLHDTNADPASKQRAKLEIEATDAQMKKVGLESERSALQDFGGQANGETLVAVKSRLAEIEKQLPEVYLEIARTEEARKNNGRPAVAQNHISEFSTAKTQHVDLIAGATG